MSLFYTPWKCQKIFLFRPYRKETLTSNAMTYFTPAFHFYIPWKYHTAWKVFKYGVFSGLYFPVFSPNTGKYGPEKTPYLDTFHTVSKNQSFPTFLTGIEMGYWLILKNNSVFVKINDQKIPGKLLIFCCGNLRISSQT